MGQGMDQTSKLATPNYVEDLAQAAALVQKAERILVIGCSGTGKSTLAKALAEQFGHVYISMDREIFWLPGWKLRPREEIHQRIRDAVAGPRWIMDGNSPGTLPLRLPRADLVIWRRAPRHVAFLGVFKRWWKYHGKTRPEMAPGCPEHIDLKFLRYIWNFERKEVPQFEEMLTKHGSHIPLLTLSSFREIGRLLALLQTAA
jgi:adenylate kinase family enzyme